MATEYPSAGQLLKKYQLHPKKKLGQNFLVDPNHLSKIVIAAAIEPHERVLEVGPGLGALTPHLATAARYLLAVEIDGDMLAILQNELAALPNVHFVQADILAHAPTDLWTGIDPGFRRDAGYVVVANLPYYITSAVIRHFLESDTPPDRMLLTMQKEVAQRIVATPGEMSLLAVSVQFYGRARIKHLIPASAFLPPPKVESAVLEIRRHAPALVNVANPKQYFQVVRAGFSQKRKQLKNSLAGGLGETQAQATSWLEAANIDPRRRAETLSLAEWARLTQQVFPDAKHNSGPAKAHNQHQQ